MTRALLAAALALALSGCGVVPELPEAGAQLRITEHEGGGAVGGMLAGAELLGEGCIVSVVGELPPELGVVYQGRRCTVSRMADVPDDEPEEE